MHSHIGIELPNKAGEVVVLEVVGEEIPGKLRGSPNNKGRFIFTPGHDVVCVRIIN